MSSYTKLASFMSENQQAIFRKYEYLAVQDLLFQQAQICQLEYEFRSAVEKDASQRDERRELSQDWLHLKTAEERRIESDQWALAEEIREKLRAYYSSMLQYKQIADLKGPKELERKTLQTWVGSPTLGGGFGFLGRDLGGYSQPPVYAKAYSGDLAMLSPSVHGEDDFLTRFLLGPMLTAFHWFWKFKKAPLPVDRENPAARDSGSTVHYYDDARVRQVVDLFGTTASSVTPVISIVALSFVKTFFARLGLVCCFTFCFALSLALATRARRIEIFAATAAFASVQVVFVGSSNLGA